ncbi:hypothetical protein TNCV_2149261 [Trichonephila clavipes]|nr:hypothetical protein TNCV_2149261 [Trichonephila clavipes]
MTLGSSTLQLHCQSAPRRTVIRFLFAEDEKLANIILWLQEQYDDNCLSRIFFIPTQKRSYRCISRINDTGPSSYRDPNMFNYSPTNRTLIPKRGQRRIFDIELIQK